MGQLWGLTDANASRNPLRIRQIDFERRPFAFTLRKIRGQVNFSRAPFEEFQLTRLTIAENRPARHGDEQRPQLKQYHARPTVSMLITTRRIETP